MVHLERISNALNRWLSWVAGGFLVAMTLLIVTNMFWRAVPGLTPFVGTSEASCFLAALVVAFSLGYTQIHRGHTRIDILLLRFPPRAQSITDSIMFLFSTALFGLATWQLIKLANRYWELGSVSETMYVIFYPLIYAVAVGCAFLCLVLVFDFLRSLFQAVKR